jgi:hypothetical protein
MRNGAELVALACGGLLVIAIGGRTTLALAGAISVAVALAGLALYATRVENPQILASPPQEG